VNKAIAMADAVPSAPAAAPPSQERVRVRSAIAAAATALGVVVEAPHALQARAQSEQHRAAATALIGAIAARPASMVL
jgi:hypothetical protein